MNGIGKVFAKRLHAAFDRAATPEAVDRALDVLRGKLDPITVPETRRYFDSCYHAPDNVTLTLHACDVLLGTCGVDHIGAVHMTKGPPYLYLNTGDSYALTLFYARDSRRFRLRSWADVADRMPVSELEHDFWQ